MEALAQMIGSLKTNIMAQVSDQIANLSKETSTGAQPPPTEHLLPPPGASPAPIPAALLVPAARDELLVRDGAFTQGQTAGFVPPYTHSQTAGESDSFICPFPHVEDATISTIINHTFDPYHLWKLDPRLQNKTQKQTLQLVGLSLELASNEVSLKEFKDLPSLFVLLMVYFEILIHYAPAQSGATLAKLFMRYTAILHKYAANYTLSALVKYHIEFAYIRCSEMKRGYYDKWGHINGELASKHLHAHRRIQSSTTRSTPFINAGPRDPCRNFNRGRCTGPTCPWSRPHTCDICGKTDHGAHTHSGAAKTT